MIYLLLFVFLSLWSMFILQLVKGERLNGFYLKGFTSLAFMFVFAYSAYESINRLGSNASSDNHLFLLLLIGVGLVCGVIGDLFLEVQYFYKERRNFQISQGMIVFSLGHFFYIAAMILFAGFNFVSLIIGLVMTIIVFLGSKQMKINFGSLKLMSYFYTFVIFTMVGLSITQAFALNFNAFSITFMLGAISFGASDLVLAPIYFKETKGHFFPIANLATYYLGQVLIALSVIFI